MVGHAGHPGFDHLRQAQQHPPIDIVLLKIALQRPNAVVEPLLQGHVLGQSPEDDHRHVGVGVDQARHGHHAAAIHHLAGTSGINHTTGLDGADAVAADADVVMAQYLHLAIRGNAQDVGVLNQQIKHRGVFHPRNIALRRFDNLRKACMPEQLPVVLSRRGLDDYLQGISFAPGSMQMVVVCSNSVSTSAFT